MKFTYQNTHGNPSLRFWSIQNRVKHKGEFISLIDDEVMVQLGLDLREMTVLYRAIKETKNINKSFVAQLIKAYGHSFDGDNLRVFRKTFIFDHNIPMSGVSRDKWPDDFDTIRNSWVSSFVLKTPSKEGDKVWKDVRRIDLIYMRIGKFRKRVTQPFSNNFFNSYDIEVTL